MFSLFCTVSCKYGNFSLEILDLNLDLIRFLLKSVYPNVSKHNENFSN